MILTVKAVPKHVPKVISSQAHYCPIQLGHHNNHEFTRIRVDPKGCANILGGYIREDSIRNELGGKIDDFWVIGCLLVDVAHDIALRYSRLLLPAKLDDVFLL